MNENKHNTASQSEDLRRELEEVKAALLDGSLKVFDTATFTGATVDISAKFAGTEGDISVAGLCHDYAVKTAQFNPAAIEVAVGDIVVAEKNVTVQ